jgi:hypothetical protein
MILTVNLTFDEIDMMTDALMNLASAYDKDDPEYTKEIVDLHNKLTMIATVDESQLH